MNELASQKLLLIAESELNRAHLVRDLAAMAIELRELGDRTTRIATLTASAVGLVSGLVSLPRAEAKPPGTGPAWIQTVLQGAGLLSSLWRQWNPPGRER